jgi:flagellar biosynthesis protein FlhF
MKVKKYTGATMQDTIFKVKADLGPNAIILNTRKFKKGFFGLFGKTQFEVLAALEEENQETRKTLEEITNLKNLINELNKQWQADNFARELSSELGIIYQHLNIQGVRSEFRKEFISKLNSDFYDEEKLFDIACNKLEQFFGEPSPIDLDTLPRVIAFIGPTGVGKTTTIAKLAAHYYLDEGKKVGLVTADTYRIAAVQQLKTYSDIINIPLHVVYNREELKQVIKERLKDHDLIFIDTAGSSWNDKIQLGRLKKLITHDLIDEIQLIISMNTKSSDIKGIIEQFSCLNPDKIVLSKLDETMTYGDIINIKREYKFPYSYITFGQDVPDDIQVADPGLLVKYVMGDLYD